MEQPEGLTRQKILEQIDDSIRLKESLKRQSKVLVAIAKTLVQAFQRGNKVLLFGNGGSAADAQHIAAELVGKYGFDRDALPVISLTTNTSSLTAIANDYGYETVFARQVRGLARCGDVVIGISTSGMSSNVLLAVEEAKRVGAITVAFTGEKGGLKSRADYVLSVQSSCTPRIQEAHILAGHIICYLVEQWLFGKENT